MSRSWVTGPRGGQYYVSRTGEKIYGEAAKAAAAREGAGPPSGKRLEQHPFAALRQVKRLASAHADVPDPELSPHQVDHQLREKAPAHSPTEHRAIAAHTVHLHQGELHSELGKLQAIAGANATVSGRVKKPDSAIGKVLKKSKTYGDASKLQDVTGLRVVAKTLDDVRATVARIKEHYQVVSEDNYIDNPHKDSPNYRSHHLIVRTPSGLEKEIQVRTTGQNDYAMWAHNAYKPLTPLQRATLKDPNMKATIDHYANASAHHVLQKDLGKPAGAKPPCPPEIRLVFGCVGELKPRQH